MSRSGAPLRLITIGFSHYCEKALRGPSQIEVKVTQGPRGGQRTTSYIIRRIEYGTLYRLTNNETSGWDIDIEVRLRVAQ